MENKKSNLSEDNWIVKCNTLNEIRDNRMTPSQLRFFSIYLSKINPNNKDTRLVTFPLSEYTRIMQFKQMNITRLQQTAEELLSLTATFKEFDKNDRFSGITVCQIFKRFKLFRNDSNEWFVSIDCHDDVLPYMFSFRQYYFKYRLWNALRLGTVNQLRMYEILKQYEKAGAREVSLSDLRAFLGIAEDEYSRFERFRVRVLDACQQALSENTDIKFTYEPVKKGRGGKVAAIKFVIEHNDNCVDQLTLDEFISEQNATELTGEFTEIEFQNEILGFLAEACDNSFSEAEMQIIFDIIVEIIPYGDYPDGGVVNERYRYLKHKYNELNYRETLTTINNKFAYFKQIILSDLKLKGENSNG